LNSISSIPVNGYSAEALSPASAFNPFDCVFTNRGRDNNYEGLAGLLDGLRLNTTNDNVGDNNSGGAAEEDGMDIDTREESRVKDGKKSVVDDVVHFDTGGNDMMEEEEEERNDMEVEDEAVGNYVSCVVVCILYVSFGTVIAFAYIHLFPSLSLISTGWCRC